MSGKKVFEIDISSFEELQDLIAEYFEIIRVLLSREGVVIKRVKMDIDTYKIIVETEEVEEDSEESTEWDFEWI